MYFKLDINVKTDKLLTQWGFNAVEPSSYGIHDVYAYGVDWSNKVIIENDEIKQLLLRMEQGELQNEERLRQIAREIEERIADYLLRNFILTYFETSAHEDGSNLSTVMETWRRLVKYTDMGTITLPTTQGFIDATIPYVGIYSYHVRYSNATHYYMATRDSYIVSIITKEGIEWLHLYLKKLEEKVPNLAEVATINTSYTAEVECNTDCDCNCGY
jgi:hypothetical protein